MDLSKLILNKRRKFTRYNQGRQISNASLSTEERVSLLSNEEYQKLPSHIEQAPVASDFAIANGVAAECFYALYSKKKENKAPSWLRDSVKKQDGDSLILLQGAQDKDSVVNNLQIGLRPIMSLNLNETIKAKKMGELQVVKNQNGGGILYLGEFPQTIVSEGIEQELKEQFNKLADAKKCDLAYTYRKFQTWDNLKCGSEFVYHGKKYVRMIANNLNSNLELSNGRKIYNGIECWFNVEPIAWSIINWDKLPKSLNPDGDDSANEIELISSEILIGGLPYYNILDSMLALRDIDPSDWSKCTARAYLNGLDGNVLYYSKDGMSKVYTAGDFSDAGFIDQIFSQSASNKSTSLSTNKPTSLEDVEIEENTYAFGVKIEEKQLSVKDQMKFYIDNGKSFMLHGPSGVGKTRRVQELDPDCICLQLRNGILPEEIIGKTGSVGKNSFWIEPTWYTRIKELCEKDPDHNHVLFIDELTNVNDKEQSLVFHIVLEHSIDGNMGALPKNCVVVAAGNSPEESSAAYNMPEPLFRRFTAHINLEPDIKSFIEWGSEIGKNGRPKIHPLVSAFVAAYGDKVFYTKYDEENPQKFAIDPRGWEQVSNIIYDNNNVLRLKLIADKIGLDHATAFLQFASSKRISIKDILLQRYSENDLPKNQDEEFALICSLRTADEKQVEFVRNFIRENLKAESLPVFDSLWIGNDDERAMLIAELDGENFGRSY